MPPMKCRCNICPVLEQDDRRELHLHGEFNITGPNSPTVKRDRAKARKALRLAGGEWPKGRQFQAKVPHAAPDSGWPGYLSKHFAFSGPIVRPWLTSVGSNYAPSFNGDQVSRTRLLAKMAAKIYAEHREFVMHETV